MAARKPRSLSPVRRTTPSLEGVEAPQREATTVSEQKINQYRKRRYQALHTDTDSANKRRAAGKATARDRIEMLLDEGSFVELDVFATHRAHGFGMEDRKIAGDGVVAGFGEIDRRPVAVYAYDATVFGGSLGEVTAEKIVKVQELAVRNRVPIIGINDSGGARIQEGVVALAGYADIFFRNVRSSGVIPQISIIAGPCTGGAVYSPAITDFIFIVAGQGYMFITGPEVIKVVTGEAVSFDELGGGHVHNATSGVAHFLPKTEQECAAGVRKLLSYLPSSNSERPPFVPTTDDLERADPELQTIVPESPNKPYDMRGVVSRVLDARGDHAQELRRRIHRDVAEADGRRPQPRLADRGDRGDGTGRSGEHHLQTRSRGRARSGGAAQGACRGVHRAFRQSICGRRTGLHRRCHRAEPDASRAGACAPAMPAQDGGTPAAEARRHPALGPRVGVCGPLNAVGGAAVLIHRDDELGVRPGQRRHRQRRSRVRVELLRQHA